QNELARSCALRRGIDGIERLARGHEQAVTLGAAEADVATHLRQTDTAEQLALRRPHRHAAITHRTSGVARTPDVAVDIAAYAVRPAFHAVDHEIAEPLVVAELVVGADVEHEHVALAARAGIAGSLAGRGDIQLLVVGREAEAVGIGHLLFGHHEIDAAGGIDAIAIGRQFALARHEA